MDTVELFRLVGSLPPPDNGQATLRLQVTVELECYRYSSSKNGMISSSPSSRCAVVGVEATERIPSAPRSEQLEHPTSPLWYSYSPSLFCFLLGGPGLNLLGHAPFVFVSGYI